MEFRLTYRGELPSAGTGRGKKDRRGVKHRIRVKFHEQLQNLWDRPPLMDYVDLVDPDSDLHVTESVRDILFVPLVHSRLHLFAELRISFLSCGDPSGNIAKGGDLDNRLKTLLDALRVPSENELPEDAWDDHPSPCFCLLEDDRLVRTLAVTADELLDAKDERDALLVIHVVTKATRSLIGNIGLG